MRMRLLWATVTVTCLALGGGALDAQHAVQSVGVREVAASERGVISLSTKIRYTTMIILPDGEETRVATFMRGSRGRCIVLRPRRLLGCRRRRGGRSKTRTPPSR